MPDAIKEERYVRRFDGLFRVPPFQHQREVIEMMMYYPKLAILLEQGLGKTFISINALAMLRELNGRRRPSLSARTSCSRAGSTKWKNTRAFASPLTSAGLSNGVPSVRWWQPGNGTSS